ncbi:MAG: cytochrome b562 [Planctomycetota bacterium]
MQKKLLALALLGATGFGLAAALPAPADIAAPRPAADDVLEESMESMNGALKTLLKGGITAETKDKSLEAVVRMQTAIVAAKSGKPHDLNAEELVGYRKMMADLLATTAKLEVAILDGKFEDATKIAKDELTRFKKEGHDKYQKEEEH